MALKIAILGSAPTSKDLAPFGDPNWEIWCCSPQNWQASRVDAWFELHNLNRKWVPGNEMYCTTLVNHPRVYVAKADPRLPNAIVYPRDVIYQYGGRYVQSFMQSQVSFMMALAITLKPKVLGLWGVDMAANDEYAFQRPGVHFFLNEMEKRGIQLESPPQSDIEWPLPMYAFKEHTPMYWRQKARKMELMERMKRAEQAAHQAQIEASVFKGAMEDINYTSNTFQDYWWGEGEGAPDAANQAS